MKYIIKTIAPALLIFMLAACHCTKNATPAANVTQSTPVSTNGFITGTVKEIQHGKDGYTAKLMTSEAMIYYVTISHANLTNPATYRTVQVGDSIKVKGEGWSTGDENRITVRELL